MHIQATHLQLKYLQNIWGLGYEVSMVQVKTINGISFLCGRPLQRCDGIPTQETLAVLEKKMELQCMSTKIKVKYFTVCTVTYCIFPQQH